MSHSILTTEPNTEAMIVDVLHTKLLDAATPGVQIEFDPEEAVNAGAFKEDALDEQSALESNIDLFMDREV